jgi:hypothetical protein
MLLWYPRCACGQSGRSRLLVDETSLTGTARQTCKQLRDVALDKQVWLALIRDLEARLFLDRPPGQHLSDLSTAELIGWAKRAVCGPHSWAHAARPTISRQHVVHIAAMRPATHEQAFWNMTAKLLPGGRYVLFIHWWVLECWNVAEDRLMWRYEPQEGAAVFHFDADIVDNGQAVVILICLHSGNRGRFSKCVTRLSHRTHFLPDRMRIAL